MIFLFLSALQKVCCAPVSVWELENDIPPEFFIDLLKIGFFTNNKVVIGIFEKVVGIGNLKIFHVPPEVK